MAQIIKIKYLKQTEFNIRWCKFDVENLPSIIANSADFIWNLKQKPKLDGWHLSYLRFDLKPEQKIEIGLHTIIYSFNY